MNDHLDDDLVSAMENNLTFFGLDEIQEICAVVEGENDGPDWHWILLLKDGSYKYLTGGCDYTGWDCQSSLVELTIKNIDDLDTTIETRDHNDRPIRELLKGQLKKYIVSEEVKDLVK